MDIDTTAADAVDTAGSKARYDTEAKRLLSDKQILARILKETVSEFAGCSFQQIMDSIEGEPEISTVSVMPGKTNMPLVGGMAQEDKVVNEGQVTFDIRFRAVTPEKEHVKLILNVEAQQSFTPGYDIVTRAVYYCARLLSSQMGVEFTPRSYDGIKKVYSIWLCFDVPEYAENTITEYKLQPHSLYGNFQGKARYDLLSAVMVCLGKKEDMSDGSTLHRMLSAVFSEKLNPEEKKAVLEEQYGIQMTERIERSLAGMCNLSDLIYDRGVEKGLEQGLEQGREETRIIMLQMFLGKGGTEEEAKNLFDATPEELEKARLQTV